MLVYCSNYSLFALCKIVFVGLRVVDWCLGIDGEPYVGEQDQVFDD